MKFIVTAIVLAAFIAAPASAQTTKKKKSSASQTQQQKTPRYSPSGHPEWDVYVRGEYVGSDPDPRIRASLRSEAKRNYNAAR